MHEAATPDDAEVQALGASDGEVGEVGRRGVVVEGHRAWPQSDEDEQSLEQSLEQSSFEQSDEEQSPQSLFDMQSLEQSDDPPPSLEQSLEAQSLQSVLVTQSEQSAEFQALVDDHAGSLAYTDPYSAMSMGLSEGTPKSWPASAPSPANLSGIDPTSSNSPTSAPSVRSTWTGISQAPSVAW